jgi:hypothetical protein
MAAVGEAGPLWWDRDFDDEGVPIRADVRQAAHEIWRHCCLKARMALGDAADAPELMESSVAHVSRHLNRLGPTSFNRHAKCLLRLHFCQELTRKAQRLSRVQAIGLTAELEKCGSAFDWAESFDLWLDLEKLHKYVSDRTWITYAMRFLDHDWREIAEKLGIAISTAQNSYRGNLREALARLNGSAKNDGRPGRKE